MVDAFTSTTTLANLVQAALDRQVRGALRHATQLRMLPDVRPAQPNMPGSSVNIYKYSDLAPATTPLNETTDPDAVALGNPVAVNVPLNEYGLAAIETIRLDRFSFSDIAPYRSDQIAYNMRDSMDVLVREIISAGTSVLYANTTVGGARAASTAALTAAHVIHTADVRYIVAKLRGNAAQGRMGELYYAGVHPDVSHDLRAEIGSGGWQDLHKYAAPDVFWPGVIGVYEGAFFVESARMKNGTSGAAGAKNHMSIFAGSGAVAEAVSKEPGVEVGIVPDKLNRFLPIGWHGILGWAIFRNEALYRLETGTSI